MIKKYEVHKIYTRLVVSWTEKKQNDRQTEIQCVQE